MATSLIEAFSPFYERTPVADLFRYRLSWLPDGRRVAARTVVAAFDKADARSILREASQAVGSPYSIWREEEVEVFLWGAPPEGTSRGFLKEE